jgi:hypothetical protein
VLYSPTDKRELWRVLTIHPEHEFEDRTIQSGVFVFTPTIRRQHLGATNQNE